MRSTFSAAAVVLSVLQVSNAQTFTDCNPLEKTCPGDAGYGNSKPFITDFTTATGTSAPSGWSLADGTSMSYDTTNGANFKITTNTGAPTMSTTQYLMFGNVSTYAKASPGTGIVSSFILESDDLDEIDWEWLGGTDINVESNFFGKGNVATYDRAIYHPLANAITGWHTYTIQWTKDYVKWIIDGTEVRTLAYDDPKTLKGTNFPQTPMKVKMGNWVGCADAAAAADPKTQGTCQWAGGPVSFPNGASYSMYVKNVTINDAGCGGTYTYSDTSGDFGSIKSSNEGANCGTSSSPSSSAGGSSSASATGSSTASSVASSIASSVSSSAPASSASAAILAQTSASTSNASATGTGSSSGSGSKGNGTGSSTTTTSAGTAAKTSSTGSSPSQIAASGAGPTKPSHKFGAIDLAVTILGLGLGYLVM